MASTNFIPRQTLIAASWLNEIDEAVFGVKSFGAVGDGGTDDTVAINAAIAFAALSKATVYFPAGVYRYSGGGFLDVGVTILGEGRNSTTIKSITTSPTNGYLFQAFGYGSGIRSIRFDSEVQQTAGCYVHLAGAESYIDDFHMNGDFCGIRMTGNVSRIRHGRFQDAAPNAIRIDAGGGDNSQVIDDVLMGAQTPANIAHCGIRLRQCIALIISNTSVIQQGHGLLIDPTDASENVFSLFCDTCIFDNGVDGIRIVPTGTGRVIRCKFDNVWTSSGSGNGVTLVGAAADSINGIEFNNLQSNLNAGSGVSSGTGCNGIAFRGGVFSQNAFGMFLNNAFDGLRIENANLGFSDALLPNTNADIVFNVAGFTNAHVTGNFLSSATKIIGAANVGGIMRDNIGALTENTGGNTIANAASSVVVNHGLVRAPLVTNVLITPSGAPTVIGDIPYIDTTSITSTQFTVRRSGAGGPMPFVWAANAVSQ